MDPREIANRIRQLQQHSQMMDSGPVLVGHDNGEPIDEPHLPGFVPQEPPRPSTMDTARSIQEGRANAAANKQRQAGLNKSDYNRRRQGYQSSADVGVDRGIADRQAANAEASRVANDKFQKDMEENYYSHGILPGEERVTTQDTLRTLTPEEQAKLRARYDASGHEHYMDYDEWLSETFADLAPVNRAAQMRRTASATPRIAIAQDDNLPPGENSALAKSRQSAGKPLPEGRDASQYTPEQRRTMGRNVHSPEVPMTTFGGTFTQNVSGSMASRAPNPEMLDKAKAIGEDQGMGSPSHVIALAQAYGIDVIQYGDDMDLLKADVLREKERHDRMSQRYDIVDTGMGGFRYTPNSATKAMVDRRKAIVQMDEYGQRFAGMLTPQQETEMEAKLSALGASDNDIMRLRRNRGTAQAVRNNWANRNMTIAANNPRVAQGLYMRSLQEAARSGDPLRMAAVHESFGNERAARDYRSLAAQQGSDAASVAAAGLKAKDEQKDQPAQWSAAEFTKHVNDALAIGDPQQRRTALILALKKFGYDGDAEKAADAMIQSAATGSAPAAGGGIFQGIGNFLSNIANNLSQAPPNAYGAAPNSLPPTGQPATYNQLAQQVPAFAVPGAPQTTPLPRRK